MPVVILVGVVAIGILAHIAPFRFVLDKSTVWRMPQAGVEKTIYLTFDDGPNPTATPKLLDLLKEKNVRATFFLIDDYVTGETAPIVRRIFAEGHSVGQHTGQRWLLLRSPSYIDTMLTAAADKVERLAGRRPCKLFRPHAGWRSVPMMRGASRSGYKIIGWSWMSWDWVGFRERTGPRVAKQLVKHAKPGNIVVIHDGHHSNPQANRLYAIDATRRVIDELGAQGYVFGALCSATQAQ
ncbi:MAG TPA: polysaccharide deacetylase family protein [Bryobacteraceae bacterium]|nr:polysaccharide deacetylase family protein [Bryobacteraceae bacterium]